MVLDTDAASRVLRGQDLDLEEVPANDCWTAACRTHNRLPLLKRNRKAFDPLAHHGLSPL